MKKLIAGNWKMNGSLIEAENLIAELSRKLEGDDEIFKKTDVLVCPPFVHLQAVKNEISPIFLGAQDCSAYAKGAYTGDVSAVMLRDAGCRYVILGHSERREHAHETSALIKEKAKQAHRAGLTAIICVGEKDFEREKGQEMAVVARQLSESLPEGCDAGNTVVAYEPVWAIGTGKTATPHDVEVMHGFIRSQLKEKLADFADLRILYGGSMKPENAKALLSTLNVDGGLIGGASLNVDQFIDIIYAV